MANEERREQTIQGLADLLRKSRFSVEYNVKKKPQGIKVIIEVTREQMDMIAEKTMKKMEGK